MNALSMCQDSPRFLYKIPKWVGEVVVDMADDIDDKDKHFKKGVEYAVVVVLIYKSHSDLLTRMAP